MPPPCRILLLTGRPGIGKTTVIRSVRGRLEASLVSGFYTEEIREAGQRRGFRLVDMNGEATCIAHIDSPSPHRVGRYGVELEAMDRAMDRALAGSSRAALILIDEIGRMECLSDRFTATLLELLAAGRPLVATVALHGGGLIDRVKRWPGSELWEVTATNRAALPARVLQWLAQCRPPA